jgi:DNA-binding NarL/FixJ family response regulator
MTAIETRERPPRSSSSLAVQSPACLTPQTGFSAGPLTVTLVNECEVVTHGVRRLLQPFSDRVRVTDEVGASEAARHIVLFDCFPVPGRIGTVVAKPRPAYARGRVVAYSWETRAACVDAALRSGFEGFLGKSLTGSELVAALEAVVTSSNVVSPRPEPDGADPVRVVWPGEEQHLTARETEVIGLITHGVSNAEIAAFLHLSHNSIKSYVRSAYRKLGVSTRAQAVLWGIAHGFGPDRATLVEPRREGRHEC